MKPRPYTRSAGIAVAVSFAVSAVAAEALLRTFCPCPLTGSPCAALPMGLFQHDGLLGWSGVPNQRGKFEGADFSVHVTHDANGFRNLVSPYAPGKRNILIIGDSFAWGWGVEDNEVFANRMMESDRNLNVYNLGIPGYGTDQEYLTLCRFLKECGNPSYDDVVLLLFGNDFYDVGSGTESDHPKSKFVFGSEGKLELVGIPVPVRNQCGRGGGGYLGPGIYPLNRSHFLNLIRMGRYTRRRWALGQHTQTAPQPFEKANLEIMCELLRETARRCEQREMDFHVVLLMTTVTNPNMWQWTALRSFLDEADIPYSQFHSRRIPRTDLWIDRHFSAYGHKLLAEHVAKVLGEKR